MKNPDKIYGLIGFPLTHSFSARFFNDKFEREGINAEYINFELEDIGQLMEMVAENPKLCGFNITIPYKEQILPWVDEKSSEVERIGAANVIKIINNGTPDMKFSAYNTDCKAFMRTLLPFASAPCKKALILGTGGASKAVACALEDLGFEWTKVSRTPAAGQLSFNQLKDCINDYFIIVNTTPLGTFPATDGCVPLPFDVLDSNHVCYDLVYNPSLTEFMKRSLERGCYAKNGSEMLRLQAELSWEIWNS